MASSSTSWSQLRQQTRSAESQVSASIHRLIGQPRILIPIEQTETLFHTYSQFSASSTISPKPTEEELRTESQIRELLDKRESLISQLSNLLDSESALTSSALKQNNLARHREVLAEHRKELQRIKANITDTRNRANLLSNVRSDIDEYRSANPAQAEADYMLQERGRIDDSHRMVDGVLSQAYEINENFTAQRETLASINRRIVGVAAQIPGINTLMNRIGSKKRRDAIILAVFIALCLLMLLYFR
jgi:Golgi SNAP receptor complex protein 1